MGYTLAQKLIKAHLLDGEMTPGSEIGLKIDQTLTQDATGTMAYLEFEAMGVPRVKTERSVAYIDHNTRTVLNGSRLGKEFSANALDKWFNNPAEKPIVQTQGNNQDRRTASDNSQHQNQGGDSQSGCTASGNQSNRYGHTSQPSSAQSQSHGYDDTSMFDGLGGLFSVGPTYDAQEEAFYREMQRRKKKKRRGPKL